MGIHGNCGMPEPPHSKECARRHLKNLNFCAETRWTAMIGCMAATVRSILCFLRLIFVWWAHWCTHSSVVCLWFYTLFVFRIPLSLHLQHSLAWFDWDHVLTDFAKWTIRILRWVHISLHQFHLLRRCPDGRALFRAFGCAANCDRWSSEF